jgi:hypothetical protein
VGSRSWASSRDLHYEEVGEASRRSRLAGVSLPRRARAYPSSTFASWCAPTGAAAAAVGRRARPPLRAMDLLLSSLPTVRRADDGRRCGSSHHLGAAAVAPRVYGSFRHAQRSSSRGRRVRGEWRIRCPSAPRAEDRGPRMGAGRVATGRHIVRRVVARGRPCWPSTVWPGWMIGALGAAGCMRGAPPTTAYRPTQTSVRTSLFIPASSCLAGVALLEASWAPRRRLRAVPGSDGGAAFRVTGSHTETRRPREKESPLDRRRQRYASVLTGLSIP